MRVALVHGVAGVAHHDLAGIDSHIRIRQSRIEAVAQGVKAQRSGPAAGGPVLLGAARSFDAGPGNELRKLVG